MNKIIEVIVSPKGETRIETKGFQGTECRLASQFVEVALGKRTAEQLTADFFQLDEQVGEDLRQSS
jgi:hypothetical protein